MTWLRHNLGSIGMAMLLSVLTWAWLYSESTATPRPLEFDFRPRTSPEMSERLASLRYEVNGVELSTSRIRIDVTGPRGVVETLRPLFPCEPFLKDSLFAGQDQGQFPLELEREHFRLPPSVQIKAIPKVTAHFVCYIDRLVRVDARPDDDAEGAPIGFKVTAIRPNPSEVRVRLPFDQQDLLLRKDPFRIQKVHVAGRTATFVTQGYLQLDSPIRQVQNFSIEVTLERALHTVTIKGVILNLAGPPHIIHRLRFKTERTIEVELEGPQEYLESVSANDLYAFVRCNHLTPRDLEGNPIAIVLTKEHLSCTVITPRLQPHVRVKTVMSDQTPANQQAEVVVLPEK